MRSSRPDQSPAVHQPQGLERIIDGVGVEGVESRAIDGDLHVVGIGERLPMGFATRQPVTDVVPRKPVAEADTLLPAVVLTHLQQVGTHAHVGTVTGIHDVAVVLDVARDRFDEILHHAAGLHCSHGFPE